MQVSLGFSGPRLIFLLFSIAYLDFITTFAKDKLE